MHVRVKRCKVKLILVTLSYLSQLSIIPFLRQGFTYARKVEHCI